MGFDLIRYSLYRKFIKYGGVFDETKTFAGASEECNRRAINRIFDDLMNLRANNKEGYYNHLKVLLIDGFALHEMLEPKDDIAGIIKMVSRTLGIPEESIVVDNLGKEPKISISQVINDSSNIENFDNKLSNNSLMYSLKGFIMSEVGAMHFHASGKEKIERLHCAALTEPKNVRILSKYFTQEEFASIYYRMMKNYVMKVPLEQRRLFQQMFVYLNKEMMLDKTEIVKELHGLHLYLINNFGDEVSDEYFCMIAKYAYCALLYHKYCSTIDEEKEKMLEMLSNKKTTIDEIKLALMNVSSEGEIAPLFKVIENYMSQPHMTVAFLEEIETRLNEFDSRYRKETEFGI